MTTSNLPQNNSATKRVWNLQKQKVSMDSLPTTKTVGLNIGKVRISTFLIRKLKKLTTQDSIINVATQPTGRCPLVSLPIHTGTADTSLGTKLSMQCRLLQAVNSTIHASLQTSEQRHLELLFSEQINQTI